MEANARSDAGDSDFEYEYSASQRETFLVDLDLSSLNDVIRSSAQGPRKSLKGSAKKSNEILAKVQAVNSEQNVGGIDEGEARGLHFKPATEGLTGSPDQQASLQILDFSSHNPIVSYQDQVYSCTWADMIGTNMFFTRPQQIPIHDSQQSNNEYDLVGTSRIKLVGHRAKIAPKITLTNIQHSHSSDGSAVQESIPATDSQSRQTQGISKPNMETKRQMSFLQDLRAIKRSRGEMDQVPGFETRPKGSSQPNTSAFGPAAGEK